jgi:hypothetical protein
VSVKFSKKDVVYSSFMISDWRLLNNARRSRHWMWNTLELFSNQWEILNAVQRRYFTANFTQLASPSTREIVQLYLTCGSRCDRVTCCSYGRTVHNCQHVRISNGHQNKCRHNCALWVLDLISFALDYGRGISQRSMPPDECFSLDSVSLQTLTGQKRLLSVAGQRLQRQL